MWPTTTRAGNTFPGGLAGIGPATKVESPPGLEDRWTSSAGGEVLEQGWGGVKGEVQEGGWVGAWGGARGVVPSWTFKRGSTAANLSGTFLTRESGAKSRQPSLLSVTQSSLAAATPLPPSLPPSFFLCLYFNPTIPLFLHYSYSFVSSSCALSNPPPENV